MSYLTHAHIAYSGGIRGRVTAAAAQEGADDPSRWAAAVIWKLIGSDWVAAWESYEATGVAADEDVGEHPAVITDQMILSAVQAAMARS